MNFLFCFSAQRLRIAQACRLALVVTVVVAALLTSGNMLAAHPGEITHVVLFWLKRPGNTDDQNVLLRASRSFRKIRGVTDLRVGRPIPIARLGIEQSFDLGVVITFRDQRALQRFERDQRHQQAIESALRPLVRRYVVYNFANE